MNQTKDFYERGFGDRLIDPTFFPDEIRQFLRDEKTIMGSIKSLLDLLVEIGCMHGRYLRWAIEQRKRYLGLDIVPRYVEAGRKTVIELGLSPQHYQFVLGGAEEIEKLVKPKQLLVEPQRCLLLFPFNSFGNILNPSPVVTGLRESGLPFLISSYSTTAEATACREQYYRNCGYHELHLFEDEQGVHFVSPDGLHSIAFHLKYLQKLCMINGITVEAVPFSKIGMAYTTMTISRCIA